MITVSDAIEVMGVVAACHHRTAPRMDDEQAVVVIAQVWAELFNFYKLEVADLKAAVMKRATTCADAPEASEIIVVAREIRRDRAERESTEERDEREAVLDAKAEGRRQAIEQFAAGKFSADL